MRLHQPLLKEVRSVSCAPLTAPSRKQREEQASERRWGKDIALHWHQGMPFRWTAEMRTAVLPCRSRAAAGGPSPASRSDRRTAAETGCFACCCSGGRARCCLCWACCRPETHHTVSVISGQRVEVRGRVSTKIAVEVEEGEDVTNNCLRGRFSPNLVRQSLDQDTKDNRYVLGCVLKYSSNLHFKAVLCRSLWSRTPNHNKDKNYFLQ